MSIVIMILLISMLIIVHEIGHFMAARAFGIAVTKFGFGLPFGPTLFKKKWGDTEIIVHALLLGGYVSFLDDEEHSDVPKDSPLRFQNKPAYQRAIVVSAGVIANVITAILIVIFTATVWGHLPSGENNIFVNKITAKQGAPVYSIGLQEKDLIYSINGTRITYPSFIPAFVSSSAKFNGLVRQERIDKKIEELKKINPKYSTTGILPANTKIYLPNFDNEEQINFSENVLKGIDKPSFQFVELTDEQKDLRNKLYERKIYISNKDLKIEDVATAISDTVAPLYISVKRNNEVIKLKPLFVDETGIIGIEQIREEILTPTKDIKSIFVESFKYIFESFYLMILGLIKLFTGQVPFKDLHGIIAITKIGSDMIAYQGIFKGLMLTSMISLNLAIMNLLPIPALDGGHLLFLALEKIQGKPINEKTLEKISSVCFLLLLTLMFFILFNDIQAIITKKFG